MKEKILEAFSNLGFKLEEEEGVGYRFNYEGLNLLYMYNENDEEFLTIALPGIIEVKEDRMLQICALLEKINSTLKYVKAYMLGNGVWLFYERELIEQREQSRTYSGYAESGEQKANDQLFGEEDLTTVVSRMIFHLEAGLVFAHKAMAEIEKAMSSDSSDNSEETVAEEMADNDDNE